MRLTQAESKIEKLEERLAVQEHQKKTNPIGGLLMKVFFCGLSIIVSNGSFETLLADTSIAELFKVYEHVGAFESN